MNGRQLVCMCCNSMKTGGDVALHSKLVTKFCQKFIGIGSEGVYLMNHRMGLPAVSLTSYIKLEWF